MADASTVALEALVVGLGMIAPSPVYKQYATSGFAAADLAAYGGGPCRHMMPLADGAIVVVRIDGTSEPLTVKAGVPEPIEAVTLTSTTCDIKIYW